MRTFVTGEGKSARFWHIEQNGTSVTISYGKVGFRGYTRTLEFVDEAGATKYHDKAVAGKGAEGYVETTLAPLPTSPLREALESALAEDFDDLASHRAYADWLSEQSDPRLTAKAEFIRIQLALEDQGKPDRERKALRQREAELLAEYGCAWLGKLASCVTKPGRLARAVAAKGNTTLLGDSSFQARFARGWLVALEMRSLMEWHAQRLVEAPEVRFLRELALWWAEGHEETLAQASFVPALSRFRLGDADQKRGGYVGGAVDLLARMTHLEELQSYTGNLNLNALFALNLPELRSLTVFHQHRYPLEVLAANASLGKLEHLSFWPHALDYDYDEEGEGAFIAVAGVSALVRSPHLKSLKHLDLRLSNMGDEGIQEIIASGVLKRLKVLELASGAVTDAGARALAACPEARNLVLLDLSRNWLTGAGIHALTASGIPVIAEDQRRERDESYLYEGDME